ncbi:DUF6333 family protein [Streptomyces sp. NBC_01353]|uniref:DUF6333 family protein n=1 Tax=Streptomyces sp. NBC_01353 TaxID=2903835 RepID=UPI002E33ED24|nr:DUF6333 family protein [Streptomyces sp. NBC_01353]
MTHTFWTRPADTRVSASGECTLTVFTPPFPESIGAFAPHDPVRARAFAEGFPTVEQVVEDLGVMAADQVPEPETREGLDVISVGCWGGVICISDPALADDGTDCTVREEARALHARYPGSLVVGSAHVDLGEDHVEDVVLLPDGTMLHASGYAGFEEPWESEGDPRSVLQALGVDVDALDEETQEDLGLDAEPHITNWEMLVSLAFQGRDPRRQPRLEVSVFRVRHTREYTATMEELWLARQ